jgi:hypothetical protein
MLEVANDVDAICAERLLLDVGQRELERWLTGGAGNETVDGLIGRCFVDAALEIDARVDAKHMPCARHEHAAAGPMRRVHAHPRIVRGGIHRVALESYV